MCYKLIVYELRYFKIATDKRISKKVYYNTVEVLHNVNKKDINENYFKLYQKYMYQYKHIQINFILENEVDTLVINNNKKVQKYWQLINC